MGVRGLAATDEARLLHDIAKVVAAAIAPWRRNRERALVDALCLDRVDVFGSDGPLRCFNLSHRFIVKDVAASNDGSFDSFRS